MPEAEARSALICGVNGQDGLLLARFLLERNYRVCGFGRKDSITRSPALGELGGHIELAFGDIADPVSLAGAIKDQRPSEIYNLAAQSRPAASWDLAVETGQVNALGAHNLFEAVRRLKPDCRLYQASSSEMFGDVRQSPQNESTPFNPLNPYAAAKVYAHHMARIYRDSFDLYISCGILFNHESRYRDMRYLTQKVTYGAACAKLGITNSPELNEEGEPVVKDGKLAVGNLQAARDWGFAGDYVRAMWLILQQPEPEDFVIGTGELRTVSQLCETAYGLVGLDWRDHVVSDLRFVRLLETGPTVADASKARRKLGWAPTTSFEAMLKDMIMAHLEDSGRMTHS
jgi:GDPmannose 4,6-dehydratase